MFITSVVFFVIASKFIKYQNSHASYFRGVAKEVGDFLLISVGGGRLAQTVYLALVFWWFSWWMPLVLIAAYLAGGFVLQIVILEPIVDSMRQEDWSPTMGNTLMSMAGFVVWPICGVLMFAFLAFS